MTVTRKRNSIGGGKKKRTKKKCMKGGEGLIKISNGHKLNNQSTYGNHLLNKSINKRKPYREKESE